MKILSIFATVLILAGCGSSNDAMYSSSQPAVQLDLQQVGSGADTFYFRGPVNIQYRLTINNPTNEEVKLRQLNLQTVGPGAYTLRTGTSPISAIIPPNSSITIPLSAWGRSPGGFLRSTEPVTVRGVAYFDSPKGSFLRQVTEVLSQF